MGTWGTGLYSNDVARDLKSTISAVAKLPFEPSRLVDILCDAFPEAARDATDEDYTTFWMVTADQFHQRGLDAPDVLAKAIEIIDSGQDLEMAQNLEMSPADQKKRGKILQVLRAKLSQPLPQKPRTTLKKPQPLLMAPGDIFIYPIVETGGCFNPYFTNAEWEQADWGAAVIIECGHVFEYLAYYTPIVINSRRHAQVKPTCEQLLHHVGWRLERPGTCSKVHFQRMQLEKVGSIEIDPRQVEAMFPNKRDGTYAAVNDISISNMFFISETPRFKDPPVLERLEDIVRT